MKILVCIYAIGALVEIFGNSSALLGALIIILPALWVVAIEEEQNEHCCEPDRTKLWMHIFLIMLSCTFGGWHTLKIIPGWVPLTVGIIAFLYIIFLALDALFEFILDNLTGNIYPEDEDDRPFFCRWLERLLSPP